MKILAVYIFREEGVPLLSTFYDTRAQTIDGLVAPFLASTNTRMEEITGSNMKQISLSEDLYMIFEPFAEIIAAIVVSDPQNTQFGLNLVARRFYKRFHRTLSKKGWTGKIDAFEEFIPEMERILEIDPDFVIKKVPEQILDTFIMADYDKTGQEIIKFLIQHSEISIDAIREKNLPVERSLEILEDLVSEGFLGIKETVEGKRVYFTDS